MSGRGYYVAKDPFEHAMQSLKERPRVTPPRRNFWQRNLVFILILTGLILLIWNLINAVGR